ncbi:citrulline utilization hydrolase CtlX [Pontibacter litorisediminis]|uniref:citrulline utilization hydrolase CtlX n=1 Tax=Pontibacter litorisediminis TaxID=1846260 RepID=UPI0023ED784D|nr:arginine deiminase-related protein [Pontibacter litorisediminis]
MEQTTDTVLMVEPTNFCYNPEAATTNKFQREAEGMTPEEVQARALQEFRQMVQRLQQAGVAVNVVRDVENSCTPDSVFPNNWFSTHRSGRLVTYPMAPVNRRGERRQEVIDFLMRQYGYREHVRLEQYEDAPEPKFLEGTGSMILDRANRIAYAAVSPRTELEPLQAFCDRLKYTPVTFRAYGPTGEPIYHTNVMLCVGDTFAVAGMDVVDEQDRERLRRQLESTGKEIIELTADQTHHHFAGNMLQLRNRQGERILVMSEAAFTSLAEEQLGKLRKHHDHLLHIPVHLIEQCGGGSVRCMIAEIFKPAQV